MPERSTYAVTYTIEWKVTGTSHNQVMERVREAIESSLKPDFAAPSDGALIESAVVLEAGSKRR